jgi:hypothetical protein
MREIRMSGSVGAPEEQSSGATRQLTWPSLRSGHAAERQSLRLQKKSEGTVKKALRWIKWSSHSLKGAGAMARYKPYDLNQAKMIPLSYADQIVSTGT